VALVTDALSRKPIGPYQLQAAIAAVHDEAERPEDTDWQQILALYELLERISDNPVPPHQTLENPAKGPI
jgi:predicted RNA polymerase sigma factor